MQLTGSQRCAVFLLAMGEDVATDMLGRMQRQEVARITEAMASLPHVPESEVRAILREARIFLETQADGICADRALAGRLLREKYGIAVHHPDHPQLNRRIDPGGIKPKNSRKIHL